ncbi:MAG: D-alanyl-D-alanine carboxypeptidase [Clostridia bacterium]|nr:D-alanyl-D-alanine carboxypeptidase [Clostridia bacterium]
MKRLLAAVICAVLLLPGIARAETKPREDVQAEAAYLIEANSGRVLYAKNENAHLPMASTTKIMTALLAVESGRMEETVTVPDAAVGTEGSSMYLKKGETLRLRDLVYGLMLTSGNDAAVAIACVLDGSTAAFADHMNARARELHLFDTHFVTPNGLHDPNHYTSAHDLALLGAAALENPVFAEIAATQYCRTEGSNPHALKNKNRLLWEYEGGIGVKTGYTKAAGKCLVFAAERGEMKLVGAVLNCPTMWNAAKSMLDKGFTAYRIKPFLAGDTVFSLPVENGVKKTLSAAPIRGILYPTKIDADESFAVETSFQSGIRAPVPAGEQLGTATLFLNGEAIDSVPIIAMETVDAVDFGYFLKRAVLAFVG